MKKGMICIMAALLAASLFGCGAPEAEDSFEAWRTGCAPWWTRDRTSI